MARIVKQCVLTNSCFITDGKRVVVQQRRNTDWSGIALPGGHVEEGETFVESTIREVKEETGLDVSELRICGIKHFPTWDGRLYIVVMFKTEHFSGELRGSDEGDVFWADIDKVWDMELAPDVGDMLKICLNDDLNENKQWRDADGGWHSDVL